MAKNKKPYRVYPDGSVDAGEYLEHLHGGPLRFGQMLQSIRLCDEFTLAAFAKKIGITRAALCDIEQGRKGVSLERAARWARALGYSESQFVALALQAEIDAAGLKYSVAIKAA